jgi:phenylacetic acid degradation operon negative regulatory protein
MDMSGAVTPRSVILNVVRVAPEPPLPINRLIAIGELFGFTANALRVAVARLVSDGLLESDERGWYRLGPTAAPVQAFVEDWRRGESRMRAWNGEWLAIALGAKVERALRRRSLRALGRLGLREGLAGLWLRPDNLAQSFEEIVERLRALSLEDGAEPFRARDFGEPLERKLRVLWPTRALQQGYQRALHNLERSQRQLDAMPRETALVQSFLRGGEAIRVLATDPLLPEAIMSGDTRRELSESMLRYNHLGRQLWRSYARRSKLTLLAGGRDAG